MSWIEQINSDFVITMGDGNEFRPLWMNATKSTEFNIAQFEFPEIEGTLVKRGTPKGRRYNLEIFIEGEDNIDVSKSFELSSRDPRAWTVLHPLYGTVIVQPIGLSFDDTKHNVSKITGSIIETIRDDNPQATIDSIDRIIEDKANLDAIFEESFANDVIPSTTDKNTLLENLNILYNKGKDLAGDASEEYFNSFNAAEAAILDATAEPLAAIRAINTVINAPGLFKESVKNRITLFTDQFNRLSTSINTITGASKKKIYESNTGIVISTMALAVANPINRDYANRGEVILRIEEIIAVYNQYIINLDLLQTDTGGNPDSYIPDAESIIALNDLINFTISNLFDIALDTKQERSIFLEKDSNVILITHRLYGLDAEDNMINQLIDNNNIGINELLQLKKGREILYYI